MTTEKILSDGTNQSVRDENSPTVHQIKVPTRHELTCPARTNAVSGRRTRCPECGRVEPTDKDIRTTDERNTR